VRRGAALLLTFIFASPAAADRRDDLIARAQIWTAGDVGARNLARGPVDPRGFSFNELVRCDYAGVDFDGRSPKFRCRLSPDDAVKVKYGGRNGEVYAEVAATRLLWALGFGADRVYPVRVLCDGCPDDIGVATANAGERLVEPAAIERRLPVHELDDLSGWSWVDLDRIDEKAGGAPRAQRDALKLLAVMLQHTDSKPEQQRLACLDEGCTQPFMLINDVGLTFGRATFANLNRPSSVNLQNWTAASVWKGDRGCIGNLSKSFTGTLRDPIISEEGRAFLAGLLAQLSDAQLRDLFTVSQVERRTIDRAHPPAPADDWVRAFRAKRDEIEGRRCPGQWSAQAPPLLGTGPVRWLQSWSSPPLTVLMNAVSLLGYLRVYLFVALIVAVAVNRRTGSALLLLLALTATLTGAAKSAASLPRPDVVDSAVRSLSLTSHPEVLPEPVARLGEAFHRDPHHAASADDEDAYGFPSGHVAAATAFGAGLFLFGGRRLAWPLLLIWLPLMALSRVYVGRHFPVDILGGVAVGVVAAGIAWRLRLHLLDHPVRGRNIALRMCGLGLVLAILSLTLRMPAPSDAGRLLGLALGVLLLMRGPSTSLAARPALARAGTAAGAIALLAVSWWGVPVLIAAAGQPPTQGIGALLSGAIPMCAALAVAAWGHRDTIRRDVALATVARRL
jgi:membrane-associated phospholipid phosphatase